LDSDAYARDVNGIAIVINVQGLFLGIKVFVFMRHELQVTAANNAKKVPNPPCPTIKLDSYDA